MGIIDLFPAPSPTLPAAAYTGTFATSPATVDEPVMVLIPAFSAEHQFGPAPWSPRVSLEGIEIPTRGDRCLVALSDEGEAWVIAWWPYG